MSLRIVPSPTHATSTSNTQPSKLTPSSTSTLHPGAPSAPGLPDTLRLSHTTASAPSSTHPLETRLRNWTATQESLQSTLLRRNFGIALPLRMAMEKKMVSASDGFRPAVLGPASGVHGDILSGRDTEVQWEDVYGGQDGLRGGMDVGGDGAGVGWTEEMERLVGMGRQ